MHQLFLDSLRTVQDTGYLLQTLLHYWTDQLLQDPAQTTAFEASNEPKAEVSSRELKSHLLPAKNNLSQDLRRSSA